MFLPIGAKVVLPIYPTPDYPLANYTNATEFSWFEAEPLNKFQFSYVVTESLQQEVTRFFANVYYRHRFAVVVFFIFLIVCVAFVAYRVVRGR